MIEAGLVYIHSALESSGFAGCGALVEGPFVVTCRHVWDQALQAADGGPVLVCFPPPQGNGDPVFSEAILADSCTAGARPPDLVILEAEVPVASAALSVARGGGTAETGPAAALAGLAGRDPYDRYAVRDLTIAGTIRPYLNSAGLRQFTGTEAPVYWSDHGCSGSPLGLDSGSMLAGILCISETGAQPGAAAIHEAFVLPASTIHSFLRAHVGRRAAEARDIEPARVPEILDMLGAPELPLAELRRRLDAYFASVEAVAADVVAERTDAAGPARDGAAEIAAIHAGARALSAGFKPAAAMAALDDALAEEARVRRQRVLPLLAEKARQQQLLLDHQGTIATLAEITALDPDMPRSWVDLGDTRRRIGSREAALDAYRAGLGAAGRSGSQTDLFTCQQRIGDLLGLAGDRDGALAAFRACLDIARRLRDAEPADPAHRHALATCHSRIGEVLRARGDRAGALAAFRAALDILGPLASAEPGQAAWQQDLSIVHERIGDVLLMAGGRSDALAAYRASLAIRESLAALDPANPGWQQNLATAHQRVSDLLRRAGDLPGALAEARASLLITQRIAGHDPDDAEFQRELSVSHNIVGFVLTLRDNPAEALEEYNASLAIIQRLCAQDPGQTGWQADLSITHERIGGVLLARGDPPAALAAFQTGLAIRRALCTRDPGNADWQRELAIIHTKVGDTLREQANLDAAAGDAARTRQNLEAALESFRASLAIMDPLATRDLDHAEWQRDVSIAHNKIGDILLSQDDAAGALAAYRASLATAESLADRDPGTADWQRDLLVSCVKMASVDPAGPRAWFARALSLASGLADSGRLAPVDAWMIPHLQARLRDLPPDADPGPPAPPG